MEKQKFVVLTQLAAEVVKFKGLDDKGRKIVERMTLGDVSTSDSEKWEIDGETGYPCKSFKVLHPHWEDGIYTATNDVRLKFPDIGTLVNAFEVTFLMAPDLFTHPRNEHAWIKRVVLGADTTLELSIPSNWPKDKYWPRFAHRKVSELKAGDELFYSGTAIDGKYEVCLYHTVQILGVKPLGRLQMEKLGIIALEVTPNGGSDTIWLDGIPFSRPRTEEEIDQLEAIDHGETHGRTVWKTNQSH